MISSIDPVDRWQTYQDYYGLVNAFRRESNPRKRKEAYKLMLYKLPEIRHLYAKQMTSFDFSIEKWMPIVGHDGKYEISSLGRLKALKRKGTLNDRISVGSLHAFGYVNVKISDTGVCHTYKVHCLQAAAFLLPEKGRNQVNHKNLIKSYNVLSNLERCTNAENQIHSFASGTRVRNHKNGDECSYSKLTSEEVLSIRNELSLGSTGAELSRKYDISQQAISAIKFKRNWKQL
jgi:hypothetical protein